MNVNDDYLERNSDCIYFKMQACRFYSDLYPGRTAHQNYKELELDPVMGPGEG